MRGSRLSKAIGIPRHARPLASSRLRHLPCYSALTADGLDVPEVSTDTSSDSNTSSTASTSSTSSTSSTPRLGFRERVLLRKLETLKYIVSQKDQPSPSRVWGTYVDLCDHLGPYRLPLQVHQAVLRRCTATVKQHRVILALHLAGGNARKAPHPHELRFRTLIHNIRAANMTPELEDYHFILQQFAAVGHHRGSLKVLQDMESAGMAKTTKTYGLYLQALCHGLTLPCPRAMRPRLVLEVTNACWSLLQEMSDQGVPFKSANVDLIMRILKETSNAEGFDKLMKMAYGIDLSYPDRPPLEFWEKSQGLDVSKITPGMPLVDPLPFSTAALNTTIDTLGWLGDVSKLAQAFEVLTTPLPAQSITSTLPFDEEDEDDFGCSNPQVVPYQAPHAQPNTMTYQTLLKWMSRAGHAIFARHYVLQAMALDETVRKRLVRNCKQNHRPEEITPPSFGVDRSMLQSVYSLANRVKDMELHRFILVQIQEAYRRKRHDIHFYQGMRAKWDEKGWLTPPETLSEAGASASAPPKTGQHAEPVVENPPHMPMDIAFGSFFTPSSSPSRDVGPKTIGNMDTSFDIGLDNEPSYHEEKHFNIDLHLRLLQRDMEQLEDFCDYAKDAMGRSFQRVKERLGRRVWSAKNVYMRDVNTRTFISQEQWRQKVNFKKGRAVPRHSNLDILVDTNDRRRRFGASLRSYLRPGWISASRGLMISAVQYRRPLLLSTTGVTIA